MTTALSAAAATPAWAMMPSWINPGAGDWFDPDNWNTSDVPDSSTWLQVDNGGTAQVTNGGDALSYFAYIGRSAPGSGTIEVTGPGSSWALMNGLVVGGDGQGVLTISNGGSVTANHAEIGLDLGSGTVTVDGSGSSLGLYSDLTVGEDGTGILTVTNGGTVTSSEAYIGSVGASGIGVVTVDGPGSIWTNYDHMYLGTVGTGKLTISNGGAVNNDDDLDIGAGGILEIGAGEAAGSFDADRIVFHGSNSQLVFNHTDPNYIFSVPVSGDGTISQEGSGTTTLTGDGSHFTGTTVVTAGTLILDNAMGGTAFANAGTLVVDGTLTGGAYISSRLEGSGQVGYTRIYNGGTIAPGHNSVGTLTVDGRLDLGSGVIYEADIAGGASDRIDVTGDAHLDFATVSLVRHPTGLGTYTILTAAGTIYNQFNDITSDYAFITPTLRYDASSVDVVLSRNGVAFADLAGTPNEASVAAAVEALGAGDTLYDSVVSLNEAEVRSAFDQLAGAPSTTQAADTQTAGLMSDILTGRIDQAFDAVGDGGPRVNNYVANGPGVVTDPAAPTTGLWGQVYGAYGTVASTGTTARTQSATGGLAMGLDGQLGTWRVGVVVQSGATSSATPDLNATSTSADYGAGLYAGTEFGDTRLALGATYTRHSVSSSRHVVFPGVDETLSGSYASGTAQGFAKVSHQFDFGATAFTPYASLQYVASGSDGYTETGGAAALTVAPNLIDATFTTLGLSASHKFVVGDDKLLTAEGGIGWRHAFAGAPSATHTLAGGTSFTVLGAPIAGDTAVLNAGLNLDVSDTTTFNLSYDGQLGAGLQTHGIKATWNSKF